jgi:hypothetical protein
LLDPFSGSSRIDLHPFVQEAGRHDNSALGDAANAPTHISLKACVSFVTGPLQCKLTFQRADPRLNARTPALTFAEPTLLLMVGTFGLQPARGRQHHLGDSQLQR